jgi:hypothetical protein
MSVPYLILLLSGYVYNTYLFTNLDIGNIDHL